MAGRPREFDRDTALARARDLFWECGYEGVSLSLLVARLGIVSSRIYAAFGSKERLFDESVAFYRSGEGGAALRTLNAESQIVTAVERMFSEAIHTYTQRGKPKGCLVVLGALSTTPENIGVSERLRAFRVGRTAAIKERLIRAVQEGQLRADTDVAMLGDYLSTMYSGIAIQARDGVARQRLLETIPVILAGVHSFLVQ